MIQFQNDYSEGAHPSVLAKLIETNLEQTVGYGEDPYCENARRKIKELCGNEHAKVHFLVGGTQTNYTVISACLRPYQGVIAAHTGHINVHETGAVEAKGHKVLAVHSPDGKLTAGQVQACCQGHWDDVDHEHMVQPGMVYISHPTEDGTLYSKRELRELYDVCRQYRIPLFLDGARLGYGLMSEASDMTLKDIAAMTDIFYIGGTKVGALFGEAVVIANPEYQKDFRYVIKQNGGMLAKGRLLGLQFDALFTDDLYFKIAKHADELAMKLREAFVKKGYELLFDSYTNQQFPIIPDEELEELKKKYAFSVWEKVDATRTAVRVCTSWATAEESVRALIADIEAL